MAPTDLDQLLDMGFEQARAEIAVKKTGNRESLPPPGVGPPHHTNSLIVQGALEWLEENQDKSLEEIQKKETEEGESAAAGPSQPSARSWVCNECDKKFRSTEALEFHAHKSYELPHYA